MNDSVSEWTVREGCVSYHLPLIADSSIDLTVTSPPYYKLKDYGNERQFGWEKYLIEYIEKMKSVLKELFRVTKKTGSCYIVVGDSYDQKCLQLVPQRLTLAATECGWIIRNDLIWAKSDAAPGTGNDRWRFTHEHVLFLTKIRKGYTFNSDAIRQPYSSSTIKRWGKGQKYGGVKASEVSGPKAQRFQSGKSFVLNASGTLPSDVITHPAGQSKLNHYATFPIELIEKFILTSSTEGNVILDPFAGTATTGVAALMNRRKFIGIELNSSYCEIARDSLDKCIPK